LLPDIAVSRRTENKRYGLTIDPRNTQRHIVGFTEIKTYTHRAEVDVLETGTRYINIVTKYDLRKKIDFSTIASYVQLRGLFSRRVV